LFFYFILFKLNKKFDKDVTLTINDTVPGKRLVSMGFLNDQKNESFFN
jgi:leucyl aminopeptidase